MRKPLILAALLVFPLAPLCAQSVVLDNARVRAIATTRSALAPLGRRTTGVVIPLRDTSDRKAGDAFWATEAALPEDAGEAGRVPVVIIEPKDAAASPAPPNATPPGGAQFTGMSFTPIFENDKVRVLRARMEAGASEGLHTHGSDTVVVHLSGGEIEDTANGKTVVNRWKPGDVEFEARGSSHSARNVGKPIDVVLVALK